MSCLWRCLRRKIATHNEIEGVALLSADHSIITLDANEDDLLEARGVTDEIQQIHNILFSDAAAVMDEGLRQKLKDYMDAKTRTVTQQNIMDAININSKGVAKDVVRKLDVVQRQTEMEHLLGTVIEGPSPLKRPAGTLLQDASEGEEEEVSVVAHGNSSAHTPVHA